MPLTLPFVLLQGLDWSGIVKSLGGWPPAMLGLFLVLAFFASLAWAPVFAIKLILGHFATQDAARQASELARAKVEADARVAAAVEHRAGLDHVSASSEHIAAAVQGIGETLAATQQRVGDLQTTAHEIASKVTQGNATLEILKDRSAQRRAADRS